MRVFVLDNSKKPLMPCTQARARELLSGGKAAVFKQYPFTIILLERNHGTCQSIELKIDPGSKITGIALVGAFQTGRTVLWAAHLHHRGHAIKQALDTRRSLRRGRRFRHMRYRSPRFDNRKRPCGWLPPSLLSRVHNVAHLTKKLDNLAPIHVLAVETVRFDTQKMQNPEIKGTEYQQGTLFGYEAREYLLEKWARRCAYCDAQDVRLEIDHIEPRSLGGTDRIDNLVIACRSCNEKKGAMPLHQFMPGDPQRSQKILNASKSTLKDATAVNATRYTIGEMLRTTGKPTSFWSGAQTKYNRFLQGFPKDHWIDALCIGESGECVTIPKRFSVLEIIATGRGSRQSCRVDRYGFPRTRAKAQKRVFGFQTGDLVKALVPAGKKQGCYQGRVAIRTTGNFNIKTKSQTVQGIHAKFCRVIQRTDGYTYHISKQEEQRFLPVLKDWVSALSNG